MTKTVKKAKRLFAAGMAACLLAGLACGLAGCGAVGGGGAPAPAADQTRPDGGPISGAAPVSSEPLTGELTICLDGHLQTEELVKGPLWTALKQFEAENPQLTLTLELITVGYNHPEVREADVTRIETEIMAGGGPDVFLFGYRATDVNLFPDFQKAMRNGAFLDCGPLLAARGIDLKADFWPCLMRAGQVNGAQYILPLCFDITVGMAGAETLARANFDEAAAGKSMQGLMMQLALAHQGDPALTSWMAAELVTDLETPLLDYDTGTVHFSDDAVRQALELCQAAERASGEGGWNQGGEDNKQEYNQWGRDSFAYREAVRLSEGRRLMDVRGFSYLAESAWVLAALDAGPRFLPVVNENGGTTALVTGSAAVNANTQNPEAAAALLAFLLSEEQQGERAFPAALCDLPVRKSCLAAGIESERSHWVNIWWMDPTPEEIRQWEEMFGETYEPKSEEKKQEHLLRYGEPLPEAAVRELEAICGRITAAQLQSLWYDSVVDLGRDPNGDKLITAAHRDYLNGEITLDELIETLEPRLQLYLDE